MKSGFQTYLCLHVHWGIIDERQDLETNVSAGQQMNREKRYGISTYNGLWFCHEKEEKSAICENIGKPRI